MSYMIFFTKNDLLKLLKEYEDILESVKYDPKSLRIKAKFRGSNVYKEYKNIDDLESELKLRKFILDD